MPSKFRPVLNVLIVWADGRGSCDPTYADIVDYLGCTPKTVQRAMAWLLKPQNGGWVKRARAREPDGDRRIGGHRYWLHLEKLGLVGRGRTVFGAAPGGAEARSPDNMSSQLPGQNVHLSGGYPDKLSSQLGGQIVRSPVEGGDEASEMSTQFSPENKGETGVPRERARAFLISDFLSVSYPEGDGRREKAERILSACGPMLGDPAKQSRVLESLAEVVNGPWDRFDFVLDVLAAVAHRTRASAKTKLWNFTLMTSNIDEWRVKRLRAEARGVDAAASQASKGGGGRGGFGGFASGNADAGLKRRERMRTLRRLMADFGAGDRTMTFELAPKDRGASGEWLEEAFRPVVAGWIAELERLEIEDAADGGGDGA